MIAYQAAMNNISNIMSYKFITIKSYDLITIRSDFTFWVFKTIPWFLKKVALISPPQSFIALNSVLLYFSEKKMAQLTNQQIYWYW